jgi:hypothetical protein
MKKFFKYLKQDKITYWTFLLSSLFILASLLGIIIFYKTLPPFLPLYNKMPWGYSRIGRKEEIFIYIGIAILFFFTNFFIAFHLYKKIALLARFLCLTTIMICFFVFIFSMQIILLMR